MNEGIDQARIGQRYLRWDKSEIFKVTGCDEGVADNRDTVF
jgi:hypothetical protein